MKLSMRTIAKLGAPAELASVCQSIAMLDAILFPDEWDMRYHSFDPKWARGEQLFSMRDGQGDFYFLWFGKAGAVLQGFGHESAKDAPSHSNARRPLPHSAMIRTK